MIECLVLGDSLAVGVGQARPSCEVVAQVGITSGNYLKTMAHPAAAHSIVISLGVNDDPTTPTLGNLRALRHSVRSNQVVWLLPGLKENIRQAIRTVARENGDRTLDTTSVVGPDHLHPGREGYRAIANWIQPGGIAEQGPAPGYRLVTSPPAADLTRQPVRTWSTLLRPGSAYGNWPIGGAPFAAIPPRDYALRALPLPVQAVMPR